MTTGEYGEKLREQLLARLWPLSRINEAVDDVTAYCAESGEPAQAAFGEPAAYAASLDAAWKRHDGPRLARLGLLLGQLVLLGLALYLAKGLLLGDDPVTVPASSLVLVIGIALVSRFAVLVRGKWPGRAALLGGILVVAAAQSATYLTGQQVDLSRPEALVAFAITLGGFVALRRRARSTSRRPWLRDRHRSANSGRYVQ